MINTLYTSLFIPIALEAFPISSSGHVILLHWLLSLWNRGYTMPELPHDFDHLLHGPIALVLCCYFFNRWYPLFFTPHWYSCFLPIAHLACCSVTTAGVYFLLKAYGVEWFSVWLGFMITAVALCSLQWCPEQGITTFPSVRHMLLLGCIQGLALLPGVSRFGCTFVALRWLGYAGPAALSYSFLIELPVSCAGFAKGLYGLWTSPIAYTQLLNLTTGCIMVSACGVLVGGLFIVEWLVAQNMLWYFAYYLVTISFGAFLITMNMA